MDVDRAAVHVPEVRGRCDNYVNGAELRWANEALMNGGGVGEPSFSRLVAQGRLQMVMDFRVNATGEPADVHRHERQMSVCSLSKVTSASAVCCAEIRRKLRVSP